MPGTGNSGGRNAQRTTEHKARGTFQPSRHAGFDHPDPPAGRPQPPKPLEGDALDEWERMVKRLETSRTLTVVDDAALYQYCQLFAETEADVRRQGEVDASVEILESNLHDLESKDKVACFQEISKLRQLEASYGTKIRQGRMAIRQYLVEFGMTPSARTRVKIPDRGQTKQPQSLTRYLSAIPGGRTGS